MTATSGQDAISQIEGAKRPEHVHRLDLQQKEQMRLKEHVEKEAPPLRWFVSMKDGKVAWHRVPGTQQVDFYTLHRYEEQVERPYLLSLFGYKVDLSGKIASLKSTYMKYYAETRSHKLLIARFAELKVACLGYLLSKLGITLEELGALQKQSLKTAIEENRMLFKENEYNAELIAIVGGSKKQMKAQQRIIGEVRKQLLAQAKKLGIEDEFSGRSLVDVRLHACELIAQKFQEELNALNFQAEYAEATGRS